MKLKLTTILLLLSGMVMAQTESMTFRDLKERSEKLNVIAKQTLGTLKPLGIRFYTDSAWFKMSANPTWSNPDTLILHVDKNRLKWLNDSTAIVVKHPYIRNYKAGQVIYMDDFYKSLPQNSTVEGWAFDGRNQAEGYFKITKVGTINPIHLTH